MKKTAKTILNILLTAALVVGCFFFTKSKLEKHLGQRDYEDAIFIATGGQALSTQAQSTKLDISAIQTDTASEDNIISEPEPKPKPEPEPDPYIELLKNIDLKALQEINPEVIGWIFIPDSEISYPITQHSDNDYYLNHTWKNSGYYMGSIFMDSQNDANFTDFNTILYGHSMNDGSMFGTLDEYSSHDFWQTHPSIYVLNDNGIYKYDIFAIHRAGMKTIAFGMKMSTEKKRQEFIDFALDYSEFDTGIIPTTDNKMLTLATCSYNRHKVRLVVQATLDESVSYFAAAE